MNNSADAFDAFGIVLSFDVNHIVFVESISLCGATVIDWLNSTVCDFEKATWPPKCGLMSSVSSCDKTWDFKIQGLLVKTPPNIKRRARINITSLSTKGQ